jgi:hypothetical protein
MKNRFNEIWEGLTIDNKNGKKLPSDIMEGLINLIDELHPDLIDNILKEYHLRNNNNNNALKSYYEN